MSVGFELSRMYDPLERIPVLHTCGHFELRLTRWYLEDSHVRGYQVAGNMCARCSPPDGRGDNPHYATLADALAEARAHPHHAPKGAIA